jgi:hypothetical protein
MSDVYESQKQLFARIEAIEKRNKHVDLDKAWETSAVRKAVLVFSTYMIIGLFMWSIDISDPWINAIVPSLGYLLSTLTLPGVKRWWISRRA